MSRLTAEERQKVARYRMEMAEATWAGGISTEGPPESPGMARRRLRRVVELAGAAAVLSSGFLAWRLLHFRPPASLLEIFLPRL